MTEKLYYRDAYATKFTACVLSCEAVKGGCYHIILDKTLFYPEGGGQPGDQGILGGVVIFDVHEKNGDIIHYGEKPLEVGIEVNGEIDWKHRFDLMQNHSGEHIISGIICKKYNCDNVGFHMGKDSITIDFNTQIPTEDLPWLEEKANEAIWKNTPIAISYPNKGDLEALEYRSKIELAGEVRIVQAGEYDCCACCGTHVKLAGEIGMIKVIGAQNYKGGTRLELLCGKRGLSNYRNVHQAASEVGRALSVPAENISKGVNKLLLEKDTLIQEMKKWKWDSFLNKIEKLPEDGENVLILEEGLNGRDMTALADLAAEKNDGRAMVLTPSDNGFAFVLVSRKMDARKIAEELKKDFDCKGGGKDQAVQGKLSGNEDEVVRYFVDKGYILVK
ncbi:alanyl-tRNA editing protein [Anaerotignum sp. MB30-C6]|uniref:alanyl-tRNA editing protein n=1 Tax=Anaerotignum sp. MB30-C6 TaxID=3070814 RepID=UPI0027DB26B9|nr:alanine--tRNA ligase-related protein [Anaerotignum sp. MB30-C6]WMI81630.1 alanine--tRNA ligase-related protein [Anaerotignum sp. MB30-C6]